MPVKIKRKNSSRSIQVPAEARRGAHFVPNSPCLKSAQVRLLQFRSLGSPGSQGLASQDSRARVCVCLRLRGLVPVRHDRGSSVRSRAFEAGGPTKKAGEMNERSTLEDGTLLGAQRHLKGLSSRKTLALACQSSVSLC
jgi:hypothetical protein